MKLIQLADKFFLEITEKLDRDTFEEYLGIVRASNEAVYDSDLKMWGTNRRGVRSLTNSLRKSGFTIKISRDLKTALEPHRETKFVRRSLDESLLKLPPKGDFQLTGIKKGINQNRYLYAYEMGLGKTYIVINVLNHLFYDKKVDKVLVVVPGEALYNWRRELMMFGNFVNYDEIEIATAKNRKPFTSNAKVVICTYRSMLMISDDYYKETHKGKKSTKYRSAQIPFEEWGNDRAIILDESHCFSYDTKIQTETGPMKIGEIVKNKLDIKVYTYNFETKIIELKKIINYFQHPSLKSNLIEMNTYNYVTKDHLFYTSSGFKRIGEIDENETMYNLWKGIGIKTKWLAQKNLFNWLSKRIYSSKKIKKVWGKIMRPLWNRDDSRSSILLNKLFCKMENESTRNKRKSLFTRGDRQENHYKKEERTRRSLQRSIQRSFRKNEKRQSNVSSRNGRENETDINKNWTWIQSSRRKWDLYCSTVRIIQSIKRSIFRLKFYFRVSCMHQKNREKTSKCLQSRHWNRKLKTSNRSRWSFSWFKKEYSARHKKRSCSREARLESCTIKKSRDFRQLPINNKRETIEVFNIELEDNKNYFADNFLVHNCIKNFKSRQAKVLNFHKEYFDYRYLMTGTPVTVGVNDYYNQLNFMDESIIDKNYYTWIKEIASTGNRFSEYGINYFYPDKVEAFVKTIKPWVGRIFTKDVMKLPDLTIQNIYSHLSDKQLKIYRAVVSEVLVSIKEKDGIVTTKKVQNQFPFISLALDNPSILKDKFSSEHNTELWLMLKKWKFKDHSKLPQCDALVSKYIEEGHRIIIWSFHPVTMNELTEYYKKYSPVTIHGQIDIPKGKDRKKHYTDLLDEFKSNDSHKILIASSIVLSTAITVTEATRTIYFDRSYNIVHYLQSVKRNHRIGQDEAVIANPLILENTLDVHLDNMLNKKTLLNNHLLDNETLPKEEWKKIFEGRQ